MIYFGNHYFRTFFSFSINGMVRIHPGLLLQIVFHFLIFSKVVTSFTDTPQKLYTEKKGPFL